MLPRQIVKIAMPIEPFYSIWARIHNIFCVEIEMFKGIKDLLYKFFVHCV